MNPIVTYQFSAYRLYRIWIILIDYNNETLKKYPYSHAWILSLFNLFFCIRALPQINVFKENRTFDDMFHVRNNKKVFPFFPKFAKLERMGILIQSSIPRLEK